MNVCALEERLVQFGKEGKTITQTSNWSRIRALLTWLLAWKISTPCFCQLLHCILEKEKADFKPAIIFSPKLHMFFLQWKTASSSTLILCWTVSNGQIGRANSKESSFRDIKWTLKWQDLHPVSGEDCADTFRCCWQHWGITYSHEHEGAGSSFLSTVCNCCSHSIQKCYLNLFFSPCSKPNVYLCRNLPFPQCLNPPATSSKLVTQATWRTFIRPETALTRGGIINFSTIAFSITCLWVQSPVTTGSNLVPQTLPETEWLFYKAG